MMRVLLIAEHHSEEAGAVNASPRPDTLPGVSPFYRFAALRLSARSSSGCTACEVRGLGARPDDRRPRRRSQPHLQPRPLAAGRRARAAAAAFHGQVGAVEAGAAHAAPLGWRVPRAARRGRRGGDGDRRAALSRGTGDGDVPRGNSALQGTSQEAPAAPSHRHRANRARGRRPASCRPRSAAWTACPASVRCASPSGRRCPSTISQGWTQGRPPRRPHAASGPRSSGSRRSWQPTRRRADEPAHRRGPMRSASIPGMSDSRDPDGDRRRLARPPRLPRAAEDDRGRRRPSGEHPGRLRQHARDALGRGASADGRRRPRHADELDLPQRAASPATSRAAYFAPELLEQLDRLPELVASFGFAWAKEAGYEADDFLAAAVACRDEARRRDAGRDERPRQLPAGVANR